MKVIKLIVGIVFLGLFLRYGGIELLSELYDLSNQEYMYPRATGWVIGALAYIVWLQSRRLSLLDDQIAEIQKQTLDTRYKLSSTRRALQQLIEERNQ